MEARGGVMRGGGAALRVFGLAFALATTGSLFVGSVPAAGVAYTPHSPILIDGNAAFTAANGVSGGSGTYSDPYLISGWSINASVGNGIEVRNTDAYLRVESVEVHWGAAINVGLFLENATNVLIENAVSIHNAYGILARDSSNVTVQGSSASRNDFDGIAATSTSILEILRNNVTENGAYGIHLTASPFATVDGNSVWGNAALVSNGADVFLEGTGLSAVSRNNITGSGAFGVYLSGSPGLNFWGNRVANHTAGVYLEASDDAFLAGNEFQNNVEGVFVHSEHAGLRFNEFTNNTNAVFVLERGNATLGDNNVSTVAGFGFVLSSSLGNRITANRFTHNGVFLFGDAIAHFNGQDIASDNQVNGLPLRYLKDCAAPSLDNVPTGELIVANCTALRVSNLTIGQTDAAILLAFVHHAEIKDSLLWRSVYGVRLIQSSDVLVHHNSLVENAIQAASDGPATWDVGYPDGGNFWWDYHGKDNCTGALQSVCPDPDGLGDTPYALAGGIVDHYPLMRPWNATRLAMAPSFNVTPGSGETTTAFTFDASASADPNGPDSAIEVRWDWNDDGIWDTGWSTTRTAVHSFPAQGTFPVRLEIRDGLGSSANVSKDVVVREASVFLGLTFLETLILGAVVVAVAAGLLGFLTVRRRHRFPPGRNGPPSPPPGNP